MKTNNSILGNAEEFCKNIIHGKSTNISSENEKKFADEVLKENEQNF